jgi:hypothetical protein
MSEFRKSVLFAIGCLLSGVLPLAAPANTNYFLAPPAVGGSIFPYTNWVQSATNLNDIINIYANGDMVTVSNGTYFATNCYSITKSVTISNFNAILPVFDGGAATYLFYINHGAAVLSGLIISNGCYNLRGGGIYLINGIVTNCIITGCKSTNDLNYGGGGVYIVNGTLTDSIISNNMTVTGNGGGIFGDTTWDTPTNRNIIRCQIVNNISTNQSRGGGGGIALNAGLGVISGCVINANIGNNGGGGYFGCGTNLLTVVNCTIGNNLATNVGDISNNGSGGGVYCSSCRNTTIRNCTIYQNTAYASKTASSVSSGGGIRGDPTLIDSCQILSNYIYAGNSGSGYGGSGISIYNSSGGFTSTVRNCLIAYNSCDSRMSQGGAILHAYGVGIIQNCTVASNQSVNGGGGCTFFTQATSLWANTVLYFNQGASSSSNWYFSGANPNVSFTNCCTAPTNGLAGTNNIDANPMFAGKDNNDFRLNQTSPCVNAGVNLDWMTGAVDLDGRRRIDRFSGIVDMGCFEYLPAGTMINVP